MLRISLILSIMLAMDAGKLFADSYSLLTPSLVDHPVHHPIQNRSTGSFRSGVGAWGENLVGDNLKLRGFDEVYEVKNGRNNGIDRIAIKRRPDGSILDAKFVEVKTSRSSRPKLSVTKNSGVQMGRKWLADRLNAMRNSGDPELKKLAYEISKYRKVSNVPLTALGEVVHVNPRTDKLTTYAFDGRTIKSEQRVTRLLENIQSKGSTKPIRDAATRDLANWDQIQKTNQTRYLGGKSRAGLRASNANKGGHSGSKALKTALANSTKLPSATTILQRSAGRMALFAALALDAKELFDVEYAYRTGAISIRQRNIRIASSVGGITGAWAGGAAGASAGAWAGSIGGPIAWLTVPAGAIIGGAIGGTAGYFGGSEIARLGADAWYSKIDKSVLQRAEMEYLQSSWQ
jgi:hypothetical protein